LFFKASDEGVIFGLHHFLIFDFQSYFCFDMGIKNTFPSNFRVARRTFNAIISVSHAQPASITTISTVTKVINLTISIISIIGIAQTLRIIICYIALRYRIQRRIEGYTILIFNYYSIKIVLLKCNIAKIILIPKIYILEVTQLEYNTRKLIQLKGNINKIAFSKLNIPKNRFFYDNVRQFHTKTHLRKCAPLYCRIKECALRKKDIIIDRIYDFNHLEPYFPKRNIIKSIHSKY
jgi:hypothetical protein